MSYVVRSSPTPSGNGTLEAAPIIQQHGIKQQNKAKGNSVNAASTLASSLPHLQMSVSPSPSSAVTPRATMANGGGQMSYSAALFKSLDSLAASSHNYLQVNPTDLTRPQSQQSLRSHAASLTPNASGSITPNAGSASVSATPSRSPTPMSHSYEYSTSMLRDGQSVNSFNYTNSHTQSPRSSSKTSSGASTPLADNSLSAMNLHGLSITSDSFHEKLWDLERREREGELNHSGDSISHSPQSLNASSSSSSSVSVAEEKDSSGSSSRASSSVPTTAKPRAILPPTASSLVDSFVRSSSHPPAGAKDSKKQQLQAPPAADAINYPALTSVGANGMPKGAWSKTLPTLAVKNAATPSASTPINQPSTPKAQAHSQPETEASVIVDAAEPSKEHTLPIASAPSESVATEAPQAEGTAVAEPPKKKGRKAARRERAALEAAARAKAEAEGGEPNAADTPAVPAPKLTSAASSPSLSTAASATTPAAAPTTRAARKAANKAAREAAEKAKATAAAAPQPTIPKAKSFNQLSSSASSSTPRQTAAATPPSNFSFAPNQSSFLPPTPSQPLLRFTPAGLPTVYGPPAAVPSLLPSHSTIGQPPPRLEMIKLQLEYYFSANNLAKDLFLRGMMNSRGYVPVCKLLEFPRLKALTTRPVDMLTAAKASQYLKQKNGALRSKNEWHKYLPTLDQMSDETDEEDEAIKEKNIASPTPSNSSSEVSEGNNTPAPATNHSTPHVPHVTHHAPVPAFQPLPAASFMPTYYPAVAFAPYPAHMLPVYTPPVNPPLYTITYHTPPQPLHLFPQNVTPTIAGPMIHMAPLVPLPKRKTAAATTTATSSNSANTPASTPASTSTSTAASLPSESTPATAATQPRAKKQKQPKQSAKSDTKKDKALESSSEPVATEDNPSPSA